MAAPYEKFADRLRQMLDRARFEEGRGRTGALADRYAVSRETARKWLTGLTLPELARIIELAKDFDASFEWLATGRGPCRPEIGAFDAAVIQDDFAYDELESRILQGLRRVPGRKREVLVRIVEMLSA